MLFWCACSQSVTNKPACVHEANQYTMYRSVTELHRLEEVERPDRRPYVAPQHRGVDSVLGVLDHASPRAARGDEPVVGLVGGDHDYLVLAERPVVGVHEVDVEVDPHVLVVAALVVNPPVPLRSGDRPLVFWAAVGCPPTSRLHPLNG